MKFWKLLAHLWRSRGSSNDRRREIRRIRTVHSLNESDRLEDRSALRTLYPDLNLSGRSHVAEVVHVPGHREQTVQLQRRFLRLSVAVVDYLLEHEWYSLLGGHRRRSGQRRNRRGPGANGQLDPARDAADPIDEPNRTACVNESPWSIVAAIEQPPDSGSTNTTDE
jgi:hypothetical protein